jgi:hypothetical protein
MVEDSTPLVPTCWREERLASVAHVARRLIVVIEAGSQEHPWPDDLS